jgi:serine/threonine protein phosphatase 1
MLNFLRRRREEEPPPPPPSIGDDLRVYAIGDIHGRDDLFEQLLDRIAADHAGRAPMPVRIILLGDLVDRGPRSAQVIRRVLALREAGMDLSVLRGNHEEVFVAAAHGDERATPIFCRIGGAETLASYGLDEDACMAMDATDITVWMMNHVPRDHIDFIDDLPDQIEIGDYLFVHAGIRPDVPLPAQRGEDLRWIRAEFLEHRRPHPRFIVHGHSITQDVDAQANRIGIDTGAYFSNRLTALGLEGTKRWTLTTGARDSMDIAVQ